MSPVAAQTETTAPLSGGSSLILTKLDDNGTNWLDYKTKTLIAMGSRSLTGYIRGTAVRPTRYSQNAAGRYLLADGTTLATDEQVEAREKRIEDSEAKEYLAQHIIINSVSSRLALKLSGLTTAQDMWGTVVSVSEGRTTMYQVDVRKRLQQMSCNEGDDVRAHLTEMDRIRKELDVMAASVDNKDFVAMIEGSLPRSYRSVISAMMAALQTSNDQARIVAIAAGRTFTPTTMDTRTLIRFIIDEYENP